MQFNIDPDIRRAETMPSRFYTDPDSYKQSVDLIFAKSWQWIGDSDLVKVPGQIHPLTLLDGCLSEPILLSRDTDDRIHCLSNVCTHRGNLVCESGGNERYLRCRYHGRRFGLDGKFQFMPEFEDVEGFPSDKDDLPNIPSGEWERFLFASVSPNISLDDYLRPMLERIGWMPIREFRLDPTRGRDYLVNAHWALYVDNYLEGFHIPFIHASLNATLDYGNYRSELFETGNVQIGVAGDGDHAFDLPKDSPDYGQRIAAYYFWLYPNTMFNFYPWGLSINVVKPVAHDRTKVTFIPYVWDESKIAGGAGAALDRVEREDEVVVELVQKGLRSRLYDRGRYSPKRENGVHQFHCMLAKSMG
jgi:choline monooxygenase